MTHPITRDFRRRHRTSRRWRCGLSGHGLLALLLLLGTTLHAEVVVYPGPAGIAASDQYVVEVMQEGETHASFVYLVRSQWRSNKHKDTSWTTFSFAGRVTVKVTKLQGTFTNCSVLPTSYGLKARKSENSAVFELDRPRKVSVEFDGDTAHPMLVFAEPLETDIPAREDPNVVFFGPGVHDLGELQIVKSNQTLYFAGGAYVYGRLVGRDASDVRIRGRGVLSGEKFPEKTPDGNRSGHFVIFRGNSDRVRVEDITLVNSPHYNVTLGGSDGIVRNVKMISWWFSTDGVDAGGRGLIEDCFFKVNDDAIKLYRSGTRVRNCVFWQMENGAPFQISWNMPGVNSGFYVSDCDIIRVEHEWKNDNAAVFDAIHGGSGHMKDYVFENIRIENARWRLMNLLIKPNEFARGVKERGRISNLTFRNIDARGPFQLPSTLRGFDSTHRIENVTFENLRIDGRLIASAEEGNFEIDRATTRNIRFVTGGAGGNIGPRK